MPLTSTIFTLRACTRGKVIGRVVVIIVSVVVGIVVHKKIGYVLLDLWFGICLVLFFFKAIVFRPLFSVY